MRLASIELRLVGLPLVRPFRTSFGTGCPGWKSPNARQTMPNAITPRP